MGQNLLVDLDIKDNLQKLRRQSGLSQEAVAAKLQLMGVNMSRSWLSAIELGKRNVPVKVLVGLKVIFNCQYDDFFEGLESELLRNN